MFFFGGRHILLFSMISNIRATFGTIIWLGQCCRMCFKPLAIHSDHFRPFPMIYNDFMEFPMFACLYLTYRYIDGLSMHSPYYSIPIRCATDLLRLCFYFIYLWRYQYSDVSIIYSFGWLYYYYRFGLQSLWTISSIQSFRHHFDLSEVIYIYIYIALSFYTRITLYCIPPTFVRLCITSIRLRLRSPSFPFVPRPYISYIDLVTPRSTLLLRLFVVLARVLSISLWSRLIFCYIHRTMYTDTSTHLDTLSNHFWVGYWHLYLLITLFWSHRNCLPELRTIRLCCFVVFVLVYDHIDIAGVSYLEPTEIWYACDVYMVINQHKHHKQRDLKVRSSGKQFLYGQKRWYKVIYGQYPTRKWSDNVSKWEDVSVYVIRCI